MRATLKRFHSPAPAEFFSVTVAGFRNSIRVKDEQVTGYQVHFGDFTLPVLKQPDNGTSGWEPYDFRRVLFLSRPHLPLRLQAVPRSTSAGRCPVRGL
jgi:hypothetical protein